MLSNICISEIAVGSQESCVSYTLMFPSTFLSIAVHFVLAGFAFVGKMEALKMKFANEDKDFCFKCLFFFFKEYKY